MDQRLRGFVGQKMGGPRDVTLGAITPVRKEAPGTYTLGPYPNDVFVTAALYGGGGGGGGDNGSGSGRGGGGGAAALLRDYLLGAGRTLFYQVGAGGTAGGNGGDSWLQLPERLVSAGGGKGASGTRAGGVAVGGDLNRAGGAGGYTSTGLAGEFGGAGGSNQGGGYGAGGGGSGGFTDQGDWPFGGGLSYVGQPGLSSAFYPGGGAGGNTSNTTAEAGLAYFILRRAS